MQTSAEVIIILSLLIVSFALLLEQGIVEKRNSLSLKNQGVTDIAVRSDSKIFATGGMDGRLVFLNIHSKHVSNKPQIY